MVRASKVVVDKTPVAPSSVVPDVQETASAVVAPVKKQRKAKVVAETPAVELAPVDPVVPSNEVVSLVEEVAQVAVELPTLNVKLTEFGAKLQQCAILLSAAKSDYKLLEKFIAKTEKLALKNSHKKKKASGNRAPSGFVKPTLITDELATFLGKTRGTKLARTEVSKEINRYIREHSLQDKTNGRKIIPDDKLTTLLKLKEGDELTYFNLQRFMKHHFIKETPVVAV
jgi:hypothetical protein